MELIDSSDVIKMKGRFAPNNTTVELTNVLKNTIFNGMNTFDVFAHIFY